MIQFVKGNFFDYKADIRVNTVNCVGVMGAGVALQFKNRYPDMYAEYAKECRLGHVQIGIPHVWSTNEIFNSDKTTIINFPTKNDWKKPSEYIFIEKGLKWFRDYLIDHPRKIITLPALGCGHGGLDWSVVKEMIVSYLGNIEATILVFEPSSSSETELPNEILMSLNKEKIIRLYPNENNYPSRLKGKSETELFIKGDRNIFKNKVISIIVDTKALDREKIAIQKCIDTLPNNFVYILGFNGSFEIDVVKLALQRRLRVAIVLPYGILQLKIRKDLIAFWDESLITLISLSQPKQSWNINESFKALKFRIKSSDAVLLTNFNPQPLTKLQNELISDQTPIFYINYGENNDEFYDKLHAHRIGIKRESLLPNLEPIFTSLSSN